MSHPPGPQQPGYPQGPPSGPGYPQQPGYAPVLPTNGKATAAMVTGVSTLVLSWCCGLGLLGVVAIFLGLRARTEIRLSQGTQSGEGLALAGIVTGAVAAVVGVLVLVLIAVVVATGQAAFVEYGG